MARRVRRVRRGGMRGGGGGGGGGISGVEIDERFQFQDIPGIRSWPA